jgi:hypothetical protein
MNESESMNLGFRGSQKKGSFLKAKRLTLRCSKKRNLVSHAGFPIQNPLLLGGFNYLEKYKLVNGKDYPVYYG